MLDKSLKTCYHNNNVLVRRTYPRPKPLVETKIDLFKPKTSLISLETKKTNKNRKMSHIYAGKLRGFKKRTLKALFFVVIVTFVIITGFAPSSPINQQNIAKADSTGALVAGSNAAKASSAGDNNGFETTPSAADDQNDNVYATSANTGTGNATDGCGTFNQSEDDAHDYYDYNFNIPANSTIGGIQVNTTQKWSTNTGKNQFCIELSWDGGTSWTSTKNTTGDVQTAESSDTLGGSANTWGRTWTADEMSNANFRLRVMIDPGGSNTTTAYLEILTVTVTYTPPVTVSGRLYSDEGSTGLSCASNTISYSINGSAPANATCGDSPTGSYSFSAILSAGNIITVYLNTGGGNKAVTVARASGSTISGLDLYQNRVIARHEDAGPITNANLNSYDGVDDTDIGFTSDGTTLTVSDGQKLIVWTGDTFTPGGTVTTSPSSDGTDSNVDGDVDIQSSATLSMGTNALSIGGDFANSGTFSESGSPQITTFTATATGHTIDNGTGNLDSVVFNGSSGGWSFSDSSNTLAGDLTMTAGTLSGTTSLTVSGGDVSGDGTINLTGGTFTLTGTPEANFGGATGWTFSSFTVGGATNTTYTATGAGTITVSSTLTIDTSDTLNAGSKTWTLSGTGTPFVKNGSFTASSSTFVYTGNGATITSGPYSNLELKPSSSTAQIIPSGTFSVTGNLTIGDGVNAGAEASTNNPTMSVGGNVSIASGAIFTSTSGTLTISGSFTNSGTFTHNSGTVVLDTTTTALIIGSTTFYNFTASTSTKTVEVDTGTTLTMNGLMTLADITLTRQTGDSGSWTINHQGTESITNTTVSWSACHGSSTQITVTSGSNGGNNGTCWVFPVTVTISGVVYLNDESTPANVVAMKLAVGGSASYSTSSEFTTGNFTFSSVTANAGDVVTIWLDTGGAGGVQGTTVFKYGTSCTGYTSCTGITVVLDQVRLENYHTGSITNADLAACDNDTGTACSDTDIGFTSEAGVLTTTWATNEIKVATGATFAPGGNVTAQKLEVDGTYTGGTETLTLNGSGTNTICTDPASVPLCVTGTFTPSSNTVVFTDDLGTSIAPGTFNNLSFTPAGTVTHTLLDGTFTIGGNLVIGNGTNAVTVQANTNDPTINLTGNFTVSNNGIFQASNSSALTIGGSYSVGATNGSFVHNNGTVTFNSTATGKTINNQNSSFNTVVFNGVGGAWQVTGANLIANTVTITNGDLSSNNVRLYISGALTVNGTISGTNGGTLTLRATNNFAGSGAVTVTNLQIGDSGDGAGTITSTGSGTVTVLNVLTIEANQTFNLGSRTYVFSKTGTGQIVNNGTLNFDTSTVRYTGNGATTVSCTLGSYYNLEVMPGGATEHTLCGAAAQTLTVTGNLTVGDATNAGATASTNNPTIDVAGNVSIANGATFTAPASSSFTVAGNWSNAGTFTANSGTVTFDASDTGNTLSGTMTGSSAFYNIIFNNASGAWSFGSNSVDVGADFTVTAGAVTAPSTTLTISDDFTNTPGTTASFVHNSGTVVLNTTSEAVLAGATTFYNFTSATSTKVVKFTAGQTFTFSGLLTLTGVSVTSSTGSSTWTINHQGTESVTNTTISWSACYVGSPSSTDINAYTSDGNADGGGNDACWIFGVVSGITVSGTLYLSDGTTPDGTGYSIKASIAGGTASTSTTNGSGVFSFNTASTPNAGQFITLWLDTNGGNKAVLVLKYGTSCTDNPNCTGLVMVREQVRLANFNTGSIANTDLADCDNDSGAGCADTDLGFTANSGTLTTSDGVGLSIPSGVTFAPGGNVNVGGSFINAGTYTTGSETLTFTATSSGHTLAFNSGTYNNITFNGSGGSWTLQDTVTVSGSLNVTTGTFNAGSGTINLSGSGSPAGDAWCNDASGVTCDTSWLYRKKITFDNTASAGALTDFPVLVQLTSSNIDFAKVEANGADLRFVDPADNTTVLDHEIENWNEAGTSYVWVRVPSLAATNTDYVWVYYGKSGASDGQNATGVWDSNFKGVWHLDETVTDEGTTADVYIDSTSNTNDGDQSGPDDAVGQISNGQTFDNSNDYINANSAAGIDGFTQKTISLWVKRTSIATAETLVAKNGVSGTASGWTMEIRQDGGSNGPNKIRFNEGFPNAQEVGLWYGSTNLTNTSAWYHIALTYDNSSTSNDPIIYVNGVADSVTEVYTPAGSVVSDANNDLVFGYDDYWNASPHDGMLDEIRYSNNIRSADWVEAEYLFSVNNSKYTYGTEEGVSSGTPLNVSGTLNTDTSTINFTTSSATTIPARTYYNLGVLPGGNSITHTLGSGTLTVGGALTLGNGTNTGVTIDANTNDPVLDVAGNFTIANNTTFSASASASLSVGGSWSVGSTNGVFTHNDGTVTFDGTGTSKTINPGSSSFSYVVFDGSGSEWSPLTNTWNIEEDLTLTAGTINNDDGTANITVAGNVLCGVTCGTLTLASGTFTQNVGSNKNFGTSVAGSTAWTFNNLTFTGESIDTITTSTVGSGNITINGVLTINDSTILNLGNRTWILAGSGTPLSLVGEGGMTPNTSTVRFTGTSATNIPSDDYNNLELQPSSGSPTYTITGSIDVSGNITVGNGNAVTVDLNANDVYIFLNGNLTINNNATWTKATTQAIEWAPTGTVTWIDNNATTQDVGIVNITGGSSTPTVQLGSSVRASKITVAASHTLHGGGSYTLTLTGTDGTPLVVSGGFTPSTSTVAFTGNNGAGNTTVPALTYNSLIVNNASETFDLAGTTTVGGDLTITAGTLDAVNGQNHALNIGGSFNSSGTFTPRSGTVTFTATGTGKTIAPNDFYKVILNGSGGGWSFTSGTTTLSDDLVVTLGTLSGSNNITVNGGDVSGDGTINLTGGTFVLNGTPGANFGGDTSWTFDSLTIGNSTNTTYTATGTGSITVNENLTIDSGDTLNAGGKTWTLTDADGCPCTPFVATGTFTAGSSTVNYTGAEATTITNATYNNLGILPGGNSITHTLPASIAVNGDLTLGNGTNSGTVNAGTNNTNIALVGNLTNAANNTFTKGSGTLTWSPVGTKTITDNNGTKQDLGVISISGGSSTPKIALASSVTATSISIAASHELDLVGAYTLTLTGNGSSVLTSSGTFTPGSASTVDFVSTATTGTTIPALSFYNLALNKASNTFTADSGNLSIGNNLNITAGTLDLDANDPTTTIAGNLTIDGTLSASSNGNLTISGNLTKNGTFTANNGTVTLTPSGNSTSLTGSINFGSLNINNQGGKIVSFQNGQTYGVSGTLTATGDQRDYLKLVSSSPGNTWTINYTGGSNTLSYVFVQDGACSGNSLSSNETVLDGGNNGNCWGFIRRGGGTVGAVDNGSPGGGAGAGGGGQSGGGESEGGGSGGGSGEGGGGSGGGGGGASP